MKANLVARIILTDLTAILALILFNICGWRFWHLHSAVTLPELIVVVSLQAWVVYVAADNKALHRSRPHKHFQLNIVVLGILAAALSYVAYLLLFKVHNLSPPYIDTAHPLYIESTTVAYGVLTLALRADLLVAYIDKSKRPLEKIRANNSLVKTWLVTAFLVLNVIYNPLLQSLINTGTVSFLGWLIIITMAAIFLLSHKVHRHTRKHSRHAVMKLHREIHG